MTSKEKAKTLFEKYYSQWENSSERTVSGYDYERTFVAMMQQVQREVFQISFGELPRSKNGKKNS